MAAKHTTHHGHNHGTSLQLPTYLPHNKNTMFQVILVGFLPNDNGRSCALHPYGCGNALVLETSSCGVGMQIRLRLVNNMNLAGYIVLADGSDGCRVCFAAREYAVGARGQSLDGTVAVIREIVLPDDINSSKRALFHRNRGYAIAEVSNAGREEVISLDDSDSNEE